MKVGYYHKLIIITLIFSLTIIPFTGQQVIAQLKIPPGLLRVALGLNLSSAEFAVTEGEYELVDYITQKVINSAVVPGSGVWLVAPAGGSSLQISNNGKAVQGMGSSMVILRQKNSAALNTFRFKNIRYRGDLLLENLNGRLQVINIIDVEQYLYGVVGAEIGSSAHTEALKAQAVVSRTYALYYKEHPQLNYDLGVTTQWQVYEGYEGELLGGERVRNAVDATKGQVIYYNNSVIQAFFHANSGGYTESCENVWYASIPYIQPVPTPSDNYALQVSQNNGWPANTYQWEETFTKEEINSLINKWNREQPADAINVGVFKELKAMRLAVDPVTHEFLPRETPSRRVTQLDFVGTKGIKSFYKDKIRNVLDLRSTLFDIFSDSMVGIWNAFGSVESFCDTKDLLAITADGYKSKLNGNNGNYYVVGADGVKEVPKQFTTLTIRGKGHGHGLGMSQWGARGMAALGSDYKQIILHYYNQGRNDGLVQIRTYQTVSG